MTTVSVSPVAEVSPPHESSTMPAPGSAATDTVESARTNTPAARSVPAAVATVPAPDGVTRRR